MKTPLELGHAAWVWGDWRGLGKRWELVVPGPNWVDDGSVVFPLIDDEEKPIDNILGCPMRKVETPAGGPTQAEIAAAANRAVKQIEGETP